MFSKLFRKIQIDDQVPLGEGTYGSVFLGKFNDHQVAVKKVELHNVGDKEEKVLKQLDHPNIIKFFHSESDENYKYFALELCDASLDHLFLKSDDPRKYKGPKLPPHLEVFLHLALGLEYIHSKNLIHRDIKPENVLISVDSDRLVTMKWADFGLSRSFNKRGTFTQSKIRGTEKWFAPELLKNIESDKEELGRGTVKSDVFAFALVFGYLLLGGEHLYGQTFEVPINILKQAPVNLEKINRYSRDLLSKMLADEPDQRISSSQVVIELQSIKNEKEEELRQLCQQPNLDLEKIKLLIQVGIDINGRDNDGKNALHILCQYNSSDELIDAIQLLIHLGIDVIGKDISGRNALHYLCQYNSSEKLIDAIKLLIQFGIDVNGKDKYGWNALHYVCCNNSSERLIDAMKLLIQLEIDVNGKTNDGRYALHYLCEYNSSEKLIDAIQLLIQLGIDVNEKDTDGRNALHFLCRNNSSEKLIGAMKLLIQHRIDVNGEDYDGWNALHLLCRNNSTEKLIDAIQLLLQLGIDVNGKTNDGRYALHYLCEYNSSEKLIEVIELLIQNGIDVNGKNKFGSNALHLLCWNSRTEKLIDAIKLLIQHGIDLNGKDKDGYNAIHILCRFNSSENNLIEAIKLLIQHGITCNGVNALSTFRGNFQYIRGNEIIDEIIHSLNEAAISC